jgi:hypothetical protein
VSAAPLFEALCGRLRMALPILHSALAFVSYGLNSYEVRYLGKNMRQVIFLLTVFISSAASVAGLM